MCIAHWSSILDLDLPQAVDVRRYGLCCLRIDLAEKRQYGVHAQPLSRLMGLYIRRTYMLYLEDLNNQTVSSEDEATLVYF